MAVQTSELSLMLRTVRSCSAICPSSCTASSRTDCWLAPCSACGIAASVNSIEMPPVTVIATIPSRNALAPMRRDSGTSTPNQGFRKVGRGKRINAGPDG